MITRTPLARVGCLAMFVAMAMSALLDSSACAQWVEFVNETATRMPVGPGLNTAATSTGDLQEKDYAWGDVDQDGDIDLVCVRKQPFTSSGRFPNILFMNEGLAQGHSINGVLVDRTTLYASAVDMNNDGVTDPQPASDQGFNTPTNDRDVVLTDVDSDGWLDIVTATTLSDGAGKIIGHPRIYMNLKSVKGVWQGFRFEPHRIPNIANPDFPAMQPRFCSVAAGDVTGDGYVDLYFGDYDSGPPETYDYNNKLLINAGASNPGVFVDSGTSAISALRLESAFGAASIIADMNSDGALDVVKQTSLANPTHVAIHHNNPANVGIFPDDKYKVIDLNAPYFVSAGDLNNDNRVDLITSDDSADHYYLNTGNAANGTANFLAFTFSFLTGEDDGFASQSVAADLNNDGWDDVLISDVDVDIPNCNDGRMHIYRNLGNAPNVTLQEQPVGGLNNSTANLGGTHNVAVFDIDNDGWLDLVIGRCNGTFVWMNKQPTGIAFSYPDGLPGYLTPDEAATFDVQLTGISGAGIVAGSGKQFVSVDGGAFAESSMVSLGGNLYQATLPAVECTSRVRYYFSADLTAGGTKFDPPGAPGDSYLSIAALGTETILQEDFEAAVPEWTVTNSPLLTAGAFETADPNSTLWNGALAAPEDDASGGLANVKAFVSQNGLVGGQAGAADIDDGSTTLTSPTMDLAGTDATISYARWFFASLAGNSLTTQVSNDNGKSWTTVETVNSTMSVGSNTVWDATSFIVGAYVTPTSQVRVRFVADGSTLNAVVEAGIDNFKVDVLLCNAPCPADISPAGGDGSVNVGDLLAVITAWGPCPVPPEACGADVNTDNQVNVADLLAVITAWGACP